MSGKRPGKYLDIKYLENYFNFLNNMSYEERISKLDLNPDRADVIVPAAKIYLSSMLWSGATKIYVPKFGLSDGIIRGLYAEKLTPNN
jgi:exopolyphosphatase/guanosine-5'-triphosphate,3'-diphosphate pyrophosphatase